MFIKGLTSVTFRKLSCERIIRLAADNGLDGIEWGGDIHILPGDEAKAAEVERLMKEAGLKVLSYGSYYNLDDPAEDFKQVCATAERLGAPVIRIWSGKKRSAITTQPELNALAENFARICEIASASGIHVSTEFHTNTYTDTAQACRKLLDLTGAKNAGTYWQPIQSMQEELAGLDLILPYLTNVHVFHWNSSGKRYPLKKGKETWLAYADKLCGAPGRHSAILEFVKHDSPRYLKGDAATLQELFPAVQQNSFEHKN